MERIDRQDAFTGTKDVPDTLKFDEGGLLVWLRDNVEDFNAPVTVSQFKGGQSNPTYLLEAETASYVLRRKPPGKLLPSAHAIDREYRVMKALGETGFPVPKVYGLCEDESVIGTAFFVMAKVDGRILWEPDLPHTATGERSDIYNAMNATLSQLHGFDPQEIGLGDFGKPDNYVARQIARWSKQYQASETEPVDEMDRLIAWLPSRIPEAGPARVVHGDFRLDNLILAPDRSKVSAVLDWELSTLGDPVADFTYHCMQWHMPRSESGAGVGSLNGLDLDALGIPKLDAYMAAYENRTGFSVSEHADFYFAYNFFRLAAILQGITGRVRDGTATNENAAAMATQVKPLAQTAWRFAEKSGA